MSLNKAWVAAVMCVFSGLSHADDLTIKKLGDMQMRGAIAEAEGRVRQAEETGQTKRSSASGVPGYFLNSVYGIGSSVQAEILVPEGGVMVVHEGDQLDGWTVKGIESNGLTLSKKGGQIKKIWMQNSVPQTSGMPPPGMPALPGIGMPSGMPPSIVPVR